MLRAPQNHIFNFLRTQRDGEATQPLLHELQKFREQNPLAKTERPAVPELGEEELTLVTWMALV